MKIRIYALSPAICDHLTDPVDLFGREIGIQRQGQHTLGHVFGDRCRIRVKAGTSPVAVKGIGNGVEVFAGDDILLAESIKDLVAVILVAVEDHGEVCVV